MDDLKEQRDSLLPELRILNTEVIRTKKLYEDAFAKYHKIRERYQKLDRELAEQNVTKVPKGRSGLRKPKVKEVDPEAFLKTLSSEQKHNLLEQLGLLPPKP